MEDLSDVARFAPNVSFDETAAVSGSTIASTVFIRGIGQTDFTLNNDPGVGVYLDGVYIARSVGSLLDLVDVESVEVLRGPQGTLFGKNTIGGAINVTSRRPDSDGGGYIELQGGNFSRANIKAGFDIPISDTLVANVAGAFLTQDGYQERILQPDEPNLGDINRFVVRGRMIWTPVEAFEADLNLDVTRVREESTPQSVLEFVPDTSFGGSPGGPFLAAAGGVIPGTTATLRPEFVDSGFVGGDLLSGRFVNTSEDGTSVDPRRTFYGGPSRSDADVFGAALTLTYGGGGFEVKSISAYREVLSDFARDSTSSPFLVGDTFDSYDQNQFSQEIQLLGELV
ncbi:MAG: TonB-dependent receptor plug domain-containing protein, partial [Pseudomonadota bacterium]